MGEKIETAFILAAGKGSRMNSIVSKPMILIRGKPLIIYSIDALRGLGVKHIYIVYHESGKDILNIKKYMGKIEINIDFIEDKKQIGSLESFSCIAEYVKGPFFLLDGDIIIVSDLKDSVKKAYDQKRKDLSIKMQMSIVCNPSMQGSKIVAVDKSVVKGFDKNGFKNKKKNREYYQGGMFYIFYEYPVQLVNDLKDCGIFRFSIFLKKYIKNNQVGVIEIDDMWDVDCEEDVKLTEQILNKN